MNTSLALLGSGLLLCACSFGPLPYGPPPRSTVSSDAIGASSERPPRDEGAQADGSDDSAPPEGDAPGATRGPGEELDTAALCAQASTCTTRVSMEVCGLFNPKCLDAFHKHADGATRDKCQAKLDRLPRLVVDHARPGYVLPAECR